MKPRIFYMIIRITLVSVLILFMTQFTFTLNPKSEIIGVWKFTRSFDRKSAKNAPIHYSIVFHFHDDGDVIVRDLKWGEETVWKWNLNGSLLTLTSKDGTEQKVGHLSFKSEDQFLWRGRNFLRM